MLQDPAGAFRDSREVLDHPGLARAERLTVLLHWERGARGLSVAEEEGGRDGGEGTLLSRVRLAIAQLGEELPASGSGAKHGP